MAGPLSAAVVGLVLLGVVSWLALTVDERHGSGDGATPVADRTDHSAGGAPVRARVAIDGPALVASTHSADAIHVLDADGSPANASVYTTAEPHWSKDDAQYLGRTGDDGLLDADERKAEPLAFLWAFDDARMAGPDSVAIGGQTLTLGPGATIRVHVQHPDGSPIAGAICHEHRGLHKRGISGPQGHVELSGYPGEVEVSMLAGVFGGPFLPGMSRVTTSANGTVTDVDVVLDETTGPFVLVRVAGDLAADGDILLELAGGTRGPQTETVRRDDAPLLVSLHDRGDGPVWLTARVLGKRVARRVLDDLAPGTTTPVGLVLLDGGVPLRGRVVHADGSPAANVHVDTTDRALRTRGRPQTDEHGSFQVRAKWLGREIMAVREAEACSPVVALHDDPAEVVLTLGPGATIEGVVRDATTGRPIDGAFVGLWFNAFRGYSTWDTTTDENGLYRFGGLPPQTFVVPMHLRSDRSTATKADRELCKRAQNTADEELIREGIAHRVESDEIIRHDFVAIAEQGATALVRFAVPNGFPVPDEFEFELAVAWSNTDRTPDEYARYLEMLEGVTEVRRFLKQGHHRFRATAPGLVGESDVIHVTGNAPLPDFEIVLHATRRVLARVVDHDGTSLERRGVEVTLSVRGPDGTDRLGDADTDASGTADLTEFAPSARIAEAPDVFFVLTLDGDGLYEASARGADANLQIPGREWTRQLRKDGTEPWVIDVPLVEPPPVTVRVVDVQGRPAPGVPIQWESGGGNVDGYEAISDDSGMLQLARFDDYDELWLSARGAWIGRAELWARADDDSELTLTVDKRRTVRLRVVLTDGRPVPHQRVEISVRSGESRERTDANGELDVEIPASEPSFEARLRDHWSLDRVRVPAGVNAAEVVVEPMVAVTVRLEVPPEIRRPSSATVRVGERRIRRWMSILPTGPLLDTIDLPRLPLALSVDIKHPRYAGVGHYDGQSDAVTVKIERVPVHAVVFELIDENDEPLVRRAVHVYSRRDRRELDERVVTDERGRITLRVPAIEIAMGLDMDGAKTTKRTYEPGDETDGPIAVRMLPTR